MKKIKVSGRFIKKNSELYNLSVFEKYDFNENITDHPTIPDNPNSNIIHTRLHEISELNKKIVNINTTVDKEEKRKNALLTK